MTTATTTDDTPVHRQHPPVTRFAMHTLLNQLPPQYNGYRNHTTDNIFNKDTKTNFSHINHILKSYKKNKKNLKKKNFKKLRKKVINIVNNVNEHCPHMSTTT